MSLATSIKDFSDTLNNLDTLKSSSLPILPFLQEIFVFSIKTVISGIVYIFTFEWFRDISYLPLLNPPSPQQLEIANAERSLFPAFTGSYFGNSFFADPVSHLFDFSSLSKNSTNCMVSGLVNSFFFSLPFSLPHLITIRRLFSQGVQAALASLVGTIAAHSLFLISIFYGLRFLIIPWFSLEPITYTLGFIVNLVIIKELIQVPTKNSIFAQQRFQKSIDSDVLVFSPLLWRISFLSFLLTWCEELNVFSSISNLTLNLQNTYLDLYPSTDVYNSLIVHTIYVLAFIVGNCAFSLFFYFLLFKSGSVIASWTNFSSTKISDAINKLVMLFILTFTFASFPYYGLDYLFGKIGGFLPEDPIYKETVLSPTKITVNKKNTLFIKAESADKKKHSSLLDINNFDNGVYLNNIDFNKFDNFPSDSKTSISRTTSFEKSNYRQENAWVRRNYLAKLRARPRKNNDNSSTTSFYKAFKDPKAYYQKVQLESDRKQSKNVRETQSKKPYGYLIRRQEGVLAKEPASIMQDFWDRVFGLPGDDILQKIRGNIYSAKNLLLQDELSIETKTPTERTTELPLSYKNEVVQTSKQNELDPETNIFAEKYTKGVKQKSSPPLLKKTKSLSTKNIIKRKFFLNPVYRTLLQTDIDAFMGRQPAMHNIAENQDYDLYKKRIILEKYYNWLRYYSPLQKDLQNLYNISESKSFVDAVFHHQFKGTFKIAKRLFPLTFDPQQNSKKHRVLSYDQTLYKDLLENPLLHEELGLSTSQLPSKELSQEVPSRRVQPKKDKSEQVNKIEGTVMHHPFVTGTAETGLCKNEVFVKEGLTKAPFLQDQVNFEELDSKLQVENSSDKKALPLCSTSNNSPFIEESDTSPFYAGWDDTSRRFVITNKFFVDKE